MLLMKKLMKGQKKPVKTFYKLINHVYEPLISKELFDKVQKVLKTRKKERFCKEQKYAGIPFVFRGLITCKCGCAITPEHHKKGNKEYSFLLFVFLYKSRHLKRKIYIMG